MNDHQALYSEKQSEIVFLSILLDDRSSISRYIQALTFLKHKLDVMRKVMAKVDDGHEIFNIVVPSRLEISTLITYLNSNVWCVRVEPIVVYHEINETAPSVSQIMNRRFISEGFQ